VMSPSLLATFVHVSADGLTSSAAMTSKSICTELVASQVIGILTLGSRYGDRGIDFAKVQQA
jgi:hypothetical protein